MEYTHIYVCARAHAPAVQGGCSHARGGGRADAAPKTLLSLPKFGNRILSPAFLRTRGWGFVSRPTGLSWSMHRPSPFQWCEAANSNKLAESAATCMHGFHASTDLSPNLDYRARLVLEAHLKLCKNVPPNPNRPQKLVKSPRAG